VSQFPEAGAGQERRRERDPVSGDRVRARALHPDRFHLDPDDSGAVLAAPPNRQAGQSTEPISAADPFRALSGATRKGEARY